MSSDHDVREDRYAVDTGFALPDLVPLAGDGGRVDLESDQLESSYFDTEEHDLLRRGVTLRRQVGGSGAKWELTEATGSTATELPADPRASIGGVPPELATLSTGLRRGRPLRRTALVRTARVTYRVIDGGGRVLVALVDDRMHAVAPGSEKALFADWREIAVEAGGHPDERAAAKSVLLGAGAKRTTGASAIARALDLVPESSGSKRPTKTAGETIQRFLAEQDEALLAGDLALRQGQDAIHPTRVATRRLRSTLRVFADYVDPVRAAHLDAELSWLAGLLGAVRDPDVQRARLVKAVAEVPDDLVVGPVLARIERHLQEEKSTRQAALNSAMSSRRYAKLLRETADWSTSPPFTPKAAKKAGALQTAVESAAKKVTKSLRKGLRTGDEDELHRARKAGKRARYAAELAHRVLGKRVRKSITRYQHLQDILGEHQDSMVAADLLRSIALTTTGIPGENGFTFGLLHAAEHRNAKRSRAKANTWVSAF
ncbi:MAG: hypothetical protein QOE37_1195 [Microbacteriaceae bacterium]|nr:hypothetical protein [Microbacteriaceae bacterium]